MTRRELIRKLLKEYLYFENPDNIIDAIETTSLNGVFYHGSKTDEGEIFNDFDPSVFGDWGATWFTSMEEIAEEFTEWHADDANEKTVVYRVRIKSDNIADLEDYDYAKDIMNAYEEFGMVDSSDFREMIPILENRFDGWITVGGLGSRKYDDVAMFNMDKVEILDVKVKEKGGEWSEYHPIDDFETEE